ncbi:hypothetical protein B0T14DRAFT_149773 [Immersiella caudata]|uniref:Uncharacterized protein n=1 Tax=Immersiella caudata TaxID=314043 RepID=A0AA39WVT2_9PEZI|nr:hypothetical protein B0T14DRAFT_149773 [Immersiella caudata]
MQFLCTCDSSRRCFCLQHSTMHVGTLRSFFRPLVAGRARVCLFAIPPFLFFRSSLETFVPRAGGDHRAVWLGGVDTASPMISVADALGLTHVSAAVALLFGQSASNRLLGGRFDGPANGLPRPPISRPRVSAAILNGQAMWTPHSFVPRKMAEQKAGSSGIRLGSAGPKLGAFLAKSGARLWGSGDLHSTAAIDRVADSAHRFDEAHTSATLALEAAIFSPRQPLPLFTSAQTCRGCTPKPEACLMAASGFSNLAALIEHRTEISTVDFSLKTRMRSRLSTSMNLNPCSGSLMSQPLGVNLRDSGPTRKGASILNRTRMERAAIVQLGHKTIAVVTFHKVCSFPDRTRYRVVVQASLPLVLSSTLSPQFLFTLSVWEKNASGSPSLTLKSILSQPRRPSGRSSLRRMDGA